jgi:hypothetical protein
MQACWDGKNLDSPDHASHVAYLSNIDHGKCPSTHPVGFMRMFYEITWDVHTFVTNGKWNPAVDKWPFVYSTGDPTGYSAHGDFQNGWDVKTLQSAIDECNNPNDDTINGITEACKHFTVQPAADKQKCKATPVLTERTDGVLDKLPGCNPLRTGPADATPYTDKNCPIETLTFGAAARLSSLSGSEFLIVSES